MPTYGWILEKDLDAFFETHDHPPSSNAPQTAIYKCPFCTSVLQSVSDFNGHIALEHSVSRPILLINGYEPATNAVRRARISPPTVHLGNTTEVTISLNNQPISPIEPSRVGALLGTLRREDVTLTLTNSAKTNVPHVSETYRLSFRVAAPRALTLVETAFRQVITPSALSVDAIRSFLHDARCAGEAAEYAEALASYVMGILHKEDPGSVRLTTASRLYREDYVRAQEALHDVERPLARLVNQLTRFALNDFSRPTIVTSYWDLDLAYRLLRDPQGSLPQLPPQTAMRRPVCPIDHHTGQILNLTTRLSTEPRWSILLNNECRRLALSHELDAADKQKATAVWAACAWRLGAYREASEPLRMIAATYPFDYWAAPLLEELP